MNENQSESLISSFFVFCSGASREYLNQCPESEHTKFNGIGATIFFTAFFASLSGGYAVFTVFKSELVSMFIGVFWGLLIFNIDRYIVSSFRKCEKRRHDLLQAIPRVALAIIIALCISRPIEIRLFKTEIASYLQDQAEEEKNEIMKLDEEALEKYEKSSNNEIAQDIKFLIDNEQERITTIENKHESMRNEVNEARKEYLGECDGTKGTEKRGDGTECKRKGEAYKDLKKEFDLELTNKAPVLKKSREEIGILDEELRAKLSDIAKKKKEMLVNTHEINKKRLEAIESALQVSFLSQHNALWELSKKKEGVFTLSIFITILFIVIELAPIIVRLLSRKEHYDLLLNSELQDEELKHSKLTKMRKLVQEHIRNLSETDMLDQLKGIFSELFNKFVDKFKKEFHDFIDSQEKPIKPKDPLKYENHKSITVERISTRFFMFTAMSLFTAIITYIPYRYGLGFQVAITTGTFSLAYFSGAINLLRKASI